MPTMLPVRTTDKPEAKRHEASRGAEGIEISAICVGLAATTLALFIYFSGGDRVGAALILLLAALVVLAMLRASTQDNDTVP